MLMGHHQAYALSASVLNGGSRLNGDTFWTLWHIFLYTSVLYAEVICLGMCSGNTNRVRFLPWTLTMVLSYLKVLFWHHHTDSTLASVLDGGLLPLMVYRHHRAYFPCWNVHSTYAFLGATIWVPFLPQSLRAGINYLVMHSRYQICLSTSRHEDRVHFPGNALTAMINRFPFCLSPYGMGRLFSKAFRTQPCRFHFLDQSLIAW